MALAGGSAMGSCPVPCPCLCFGYGSACVCVTVCVMGTYCCLQELLAEWQLCREPRSVCGQLRQGLVLGLVWLLCLGITLGCTMAVLTFSEVMIQVLAGTGEGTWLPPTGFSCSLLPLSQALPVFLAFALAPCPLPVWFELSLGRAGCLRRSYYLLALPPVLPGPLSATPHP